jgi:hypothetical protein
MDQNTRYGFLVSRLNNPVTLTYGGEAFIVPPRATRLPSGTDQFIDKTLLGSLPEGIFYIPVKDSL